MGFTRTIDGLCCDDCGSDRLGYICTRGCTQMVCSCQPCESCDYREEEMERQHALMSDEQYEEEIRNAQEGNEYF